MSITRVDVDRDNLTITVIADFDAPSSKSGSFGRIPASSKGGGPPSYPATFAQHDLSPGGEVKYS